ncbi:MAG: PfkB family carbohydrate kinase [Methanosarcina sp.]|nr:PfkB family carbohydrate kinase [Methanosarcina sp.]
MNKLSDDQIYDLGKILAIASLTCIGLSLNATAGIGVLTCIGANIVSDKLKSICTKFPEHWLSRKGAQNPDIQQILNLASIKALEDLEKIYLDGVKDDDQLIQKNFEDLNKYMKNEFLVLVEEEAIKDDVKQYLSLDAENAAQQIGERIGKTNFLGAQHNDSFKIFFIKYYFSYFQLKFYELLDKNEVECNRAWRAFQKLLLEGMMSNLQSVQTNQTSIIENQESIQNALKKLDDIKGLLQNSTDPREQNEPFDDVIKEIINNSHASLQDRISEIKKSSEIIKEKTEEIDDKLNQINRKIEANYYIYTNAIDHFLKLCESYDIKCKNVLVVGEVMLDHKMEASNAKYGIVQKHLLLKQGEGEVYMVFRDIKTLGGASDVAMAFSLLSNVSLIGVIGTDSEGDDLVNLCKYHNIPFDPVRTPEVITTKKIYLHRSTEGPDLPVIRFDRENINLMTNYCKDEEVQKNIIEKIKNIDNIDCIVIKDHQKGMITKELIEKIAAIASIKNIPLYVDPKYDWNIFEDVNIEAIIPNMKEAASGIFDMKTQEHEILVRDNECKFKNYFEYANLANKYQNCKNIIIKASKKGAVIISEDAKVKAKVIKPLLVEDELNTDVGCGDVFDAFVIIGMLNKLTLEESVLFANFVAGLKAKKALGEHISIENVKKELDQYSFKSYVSENIILIDQMLKNSRNRKTQPIPAK